MATSVKPARQLHTINGYAVLAVPENVAGEALDEFLEEATDCVHQSSYRGVVVDLRGLDIVDAQIVSSVENFVNVLQVLGYPCAVSGILPEWACVMAETGFGFRADVNTQWRAEDAVKCLRDPVSERLRR